MDGLPYDWAELPLVLTSEQVAGLLQLHVNSVKALCRAGRLPAVKIGNAWRINRADLMDLMAARRTGPLKAFLDLLSVGVIVADPTGKITIVNRAANAMVGGRVADNVFHTGSDYVIHAPDGGAFPMEQLPLERGLRGEASQDIETLVHRSDGRQLAILSSGRPLRGPDGEVTGAVATLQDISALAEARRTEAATRSSLATERDRLRVLHELDRAILSAQSSREVAEVATRLLVKATAAARAAVRLIDFETGQSEYLAAEGVSLSFPVRGKSHERYWLLEENRRGETGVIPDVAALPFEDDLKAAVLAAGIRCYVGVPLAIGEQVIGAVILGFAEPGPLSQSTLDFLRQVADQLALGIHNAALFDEVRGSRWQLQALSRKLVQIQEAERKALSRELHDETGQGMTALKLRLGSLKRLITDPEALQQVDALLEVSEETMEALHRLAVNLRPSSLDRYGLVPALEQYLASFRKQTNLEVEFIASDLSEERLPDNVETALYRVVQEALTNVARYANASHVAVVLRRVDDRVMVVIEDDGVGFDPDEALRRGRLGIVGMRERAEMLGGTLAIESSPGNGTALSVNVPAHPSEGMEAAARSDDQPLPINERRAAPIREETTENQKSHREAELARSKTLSDALVEIIGFMAGSASAESALPEVLARTATAIGCDSGYIEVRDGDTWVVRYAHPASSPFLGQRYRDEESPSITWAAQHRQVLVADTRDDPRVDTGLLRQYGIGSRAALPLLSGDRLLGVLALNRHAEPVPFEPSEIEFLNRLMAAVSLALENAELHEVENRQRQELARRVEELEALLDLLPVGIGIAYDPGCQVVNANSSLTRMLAMPEGANPSLSANEGHGQVPYKVYMGGRELAPIELPMQVAAGQGIEVRDQILQIVRNDGMRLTLLGSAVPLFTPDGKTRGSIAAFADVSELKQAEALREAALAEGERLLAQVKNQAETLEMANEELQQQAEELEVQSEELRAQNDELAEVTRQLEEALKAEGEARRLFQAVLENATAGIAVLDGQDLRVKYANAAYRHFLDEPYSEADLTGFRLRDFIPQAGVSDLEEIFHRVIRTGRPQFYPDYEFPGLARGTTYWRLSLLPLQLEGLPAPDILVVAVETTDQKRMEVSLRRARDELEARVQERTAELSQSIDLLNLTHDAVVIHDMGATLRFWNHGAEELYGWTSGEALNKRIHDLLETEFPEDLDRIYAHLLQSGRWEGELVHTRRDGTRTLEMSHWTLQRGAAGQILAVMEINTDITVQRRIQEDIVRERNLLRTLMDRSPDCIYIKDTESRFISTNAEHLRVLGLATVEEVVGKSDLELFPRELAEQYYADEREVIRTGQPLLNREERVIDAQGHNRWYLTSKTPFYDAHGRVAGLVGVSRDITNRKRAEEKLEAVVEELEASRSQMKALSRRVVETQERERRYVADQLYNEVGQVLAALKMHLSAAGGEAISAARLTETQDLIDRVMRDLHHLAVDLHPASLDRLGLVCALKQYGDEWSREHGLPVQFEATNLESAEIPARIEIAVYRIVQEALANVALHARASTVAIAISRVESRLAVVVEDDGEGFDLATAMHEGAIGLVGMRERAEAMGGHLVVESAPGRGTSVIVEVAIDAAL